MTGGKGCTPELPPPAGPSEAPAGGKAATHRSPTSRRSPYTDRRLHQLPTGVSQTTIAEEETREAGMRRLTRASSRQGGISTVTWAPTLPEPAPRAHGKLGCSVPPPRPPPRPDPIGVPPPYPAPKAAEQTVQRPALTLRERQGWTEEELQTGRASPFYPPPRQYTTQEWNDWWRRDYRDPEQGGWDGWYWDWTLNEWRWQA